MFNGLVLVMVNECGEEVEIERYSASFANVLNEDESGYALLLWEEVKMENARERFPEARSFYFEDRRGWHSIINEMIANPALEFEDFY